MITCEVGADGLRDCFRNPIPEIFEAAVLLQHAVAAHRSGNGFVADALIRAADMPIIGEWLDSIWSGEGNNPYRGIRKIGDLPPLVPKAERYQPRNPPRGMEQALVARDGHHCRFCGIPLVRAAVRKALAEDYPQATRWTGTRSSQQHRGLQVMWLQYDHVVVHSHGGTTTMENLVVTCPACNYGRDRWTLEEVGLRDPRTHRRLPYWTGASHWNGLEVVLPERHRYPSVFLSDYEAGQPVAAARDGSVCSLVMGFVLFEDGLSWCDDSILNPPNPNHAFHHLYGDVVFSGSSVSCGDVSFAPIEQGSHAAACWNAMRTSSANELSRHQVIETGLREDRREHDRLSKQEF
jgi:5-methylcytosine-specific restriction endonuclease McrA